MSDFAPPPEIPEEVWKHLRRIQEIQDQITAGCLEAMNFPQRRGARAEAAIDRMADAAERKQQ